MLKRSLLSLIHRCRSARLTMTPSPEFSTSIYNMHNSIAALFVPALVDPRHLSTKLGRTSDRVLSVEASAWENDPGINHSSDSPRGVLPAILEQRTNSIYSLLLRNGITIRDPLLPVIRTPNQHSSQNSHYRIRTGGLRSDTVGRTDHHLKMSFRIC
jgi:hypothetical protein